MHNLYKPFQCYIAIPIYLTKHESLTRVQRPCSAASHVFKNVVKISSIGCKKKIAYFYCKMNISELTVQSAF